MRPVDGGGPAAEVAPRPMVIRKGCLLRGHGLPLRGHGLPCGWMKELVFARM